MKSSLILLLILTPASAGEAVGAEEQAAVTIASVQQAAFADHNVQYQFRTESNGGQVSIILRQVSVIWP